MAVVHVLAMADSLDAEAVVLAVSSDACPIVTSADLIARISGKEVKAQLCPLGRLDNFVSRGRRPRDTGHQASPRRDTPVDHPVAQDVANRL